MQITGREGERDGKTQRKKKPVARLFLLSITKHPSHVLNFCTAYRHESHKQHDIHQVFGQRLPTGKNHYGKVSHHHTPDSRTASRTNCQQ